MSLLTQILLEYRILATKLSKYEMLPAEIRMNDKLIRDESIDAESLIEGHRREMGYFLGNWSYNDIRQQAEDDDVILSVEEVVKVGAYIIANHDANVGVNWEVISDAITYVTNTTE